MTVEAANGNRSVLVIVKARHLEHAEALVTELAAQGLRVACLELPPEAELCSTCGPMLRATRHAFMEGVVTAAIMGVVLSVIMVVLFQLL